MEGNSRQRQGAPQAQLLLLSSATIPHSLYSDTAKHLLPTPRRPRVSPGQPLTHACFMKREVHYAELKGEAQPHSGQRSCVADAFLTRFWVFPRSDNTCLVAGRETAEKGNQSVQCLPPGKPRAWYGLDRIGLPKLMQMSKPPNGLID